MSTLRQLLTGLQTHLQVSVDEASTSGRGLESTASSLQAQGLRGPPLRSRPLDGSLDEDDDGPEFGRDRCIFHLLMAIWQMLPLSHSLRGLGAESLDHKGHACQQPAMWLAFAAARDKGRKPPKNCTSRNANVISTQAVFHGRACGVLACLGRIQRKVLEAT